MRTTKQRVFKTGEMATIAGHCLSVIYGGGDVINYLTEKGLSDPVNQWYNIRRWIKSNLSEMYADIPEALKGEMILQNEKAPHEEATVAEGREPDPKPEMEVKAETTEAEPKKRRGRPPKQKDNAVNEQKDESDTRPRETAVKLRVNEVCGKKLTYTRNRDCITLHVFGFDGKISLTPNELKIVCEEIPQVIKILEK